jgi:hypothetical protein
MILGFLISTLLVGSAMQNIPDADGWVSVERPQVYSEEFEGEENEAWAVFCKEIEGEKFFVRFPDDPSYRYFPGGVQLDASLGNDVFSLRVEKNKGEESESLFAGRIQEVSAQSETLLIKSAKGADRQTLDLFYRSSGKWVWEKIRSTPNFLYILRTESPEMSGQSHHFFASSLEIFYTTSSGP